ncbi:bifunctional serine/threonine-protein kinase/formylglycine-generating enzyme family protein [Halioxenophilus aromaticivorans]|uniref:non-specific serine/threonine protein kinase n=1 Tax=Halioxenophilus aromaticivorans TaxID=1306992 RepID=A0AAV3TY55_9ALTE
MRLPGYKILRKINQGGMSTVYLAVQTEHNRMVALKVMAPALNADPIFSDRFQREAKIISQLAHPNIIAIHDVGQYKTINYIAMDYMEQGSIAAKMKEGLTAKSCLKIIQQVSKALDHAHAEGYIHRDIKPENILLAQDGSVALSDFGVARAVSSNTQMTNAGTVLGTPNYMSPEQARGKDLDGRSDLYSLGVVLYEMLVGQPPYQGEEAVAIALQHLTAPIPALPPKYASLQPLINKMVAKKPQDRFQSGTEAVEVIDQVMDKLNGDAADDQELALLRPARGKRSWWCRITGRRPKYSPLNDIPALRGSATMHDTRPANNTANWVALAALFMVVAVATAYWYWQSYQLPEPPAVTAIGVPMETSTPIMPPDSDGTAPPIELASEVSEGAIERPEPAIPVSAEPEPEQPPLPPPEPTFPLTVNVTPEQNSYVRVMNIVEKYRPGLPLPAGEYRIVIGSPGYWQKERWVTIENSAKNINVQLTVAKHPGDLIQHQPLPGVDGPEMIVIPPGQFIMGDLRYSDTQPRHEVVIEKPFAISSGEVRFAEYDAYLAATGKPMLGDESWGRNTRPVINISWQEAKDYADWLAEKTGKPYRLPTEAEWEYIASSGGLQEYPWSGGAEDGKELANCRGGCRSEYNTLFVSKTAPTKKFSANTFGVYDLAGNVAEWTSTCYMRTYDPVDGPEQASCDRVVRGGSFINDIEQLDVFRRDHYPEDYRDKYTGLRVALDLPAYSEE